MFKKFLVTTASAATFALAACGGGGGSDPGNTGGGGGGGGGGNNPPPPVQYNVSGPMDAVQGPMTSTVFGQLEAATEGTPLKALLVCADRTVNRDALDFADTIANALQTAAASGASSATALTGTAPALNGSVLQLANDLQGMLNSLAGVGTCGLNGLPTGAALGSNPLAGTPLAPLGTELMSVLATINTLQPGNGSTPLSMAQLYALVHQLRQQIDTGLAGAIALDPAVASTPMVGGILVSVQQSLHDLEDVMLAAATANPAAVKAAINSLLDNSLTNQLTRVVPLGFIEQQASQVGLFSLPVATGSSGIADLFSGSIGTIYTTQALKDALALQFDPLVDPIASQVLPVLSDNFVLAFLHMDDISDALTGTQLDDALGAVFNVLGPVGGAGQPVTTVLADIVGAVNVGGVCSLLGGLFGSLCNP